MGVFIYPLTPVSVVGGATEATAQDQLAELQDINTNTAGLTDVASATKQDQQTASLFNIESAITDLNSKATEIDTGAVVIASSALPSGAAEENTLIDVATFTGNIDGKIASAMVNERFDYQAFTYVPSGNGAGEVETVVYKLGGSGGATVATVTLAYDASNRVSSVTRS